MASKLCTKIFHTTAEKVAKHEAAITNRLRTASKRLQRTPEYKDAAIKEFKRSKDKSKKTRDGANVDFGDFLHRCASARAETTLS
jgi:hypothetical protein